MKIVNEELIQIKKTKTIEMYFSQEDKGVWIFYKDKFGGIEDTLHIPMSKVFQVKRGLESAVQRFYRKKK